MICNEWPRGRLLVELPKSIIQWIKDPYQDPTPGVNVLRDLRWIGLEVVIPELEFYLNKSLTINIV